jgi:hypothetical protein
MQKPSLGRIVLVKTPVFPVSINNGGDVAPAIITRVNSDTSVNVRVLCDSDETLWKTSLVLVDDEAQAIGYHCYWPPRV